MPEPHPELARPPGGPPPPAPPVAGPWVRAQGIDDEAVERAAPGTRW